MPSSSNQIPHNDRPPINLPDLPMFPDAQRDGLIGMDKNQWSTLPSPQQDRMCQPMTRHRPQHASQAYPEVTVDAPQRENDGRFNPNRYPSRSRPRGYPPQKTSPQQMYNQFSRHTQAQAQQNPTQEEVPYEVPPAFSDDPIHSSGYRRDEYVQCNDYLDRTRSHDEIPYAQRFSQNHFQKEHCVVCPPTAPCNCNRNGNRSGQRSNVYKDSPEYGDQRHIDRTEENFHHDYQTPLCSRPVLGQSPKQQNQRFDTISPLYYPHQIAKTRGGSENQFQKANVPENRRNEIWRHEREMGNTSEFDDYHMHAKQPGENQRLDHRQYNTPENLGNDGYQMHEHHLRAENQHLDQHQYNTTTNLGKNGYQRVNQRLDQQQYNTTTNLGKDGYQRENQRLDQEQYNTTTNLGKDGYQRHEHHLRAQPYSRKEGQQRDAYSSNRQMRGHAQTPSNNFPPPPRVPHGGGRPNNPGLSPGSNRSLPNLAPDFHEFGRENLSRNPVQNSFSERKYQLEGTHYPIQTAFPNKTVRHGSVSEASANNKSITASKPTIDFRDRELHLLKEVRSATKMQKSAENEGDRCFWTKQLNILKRDLEALQEHNERNISIVGGITVVNGADSVVSSKSQKSRFSVIKVRAPKNLPGGYQFKANVDGKAVSGIVPQGGVTMGEIFPVSIKLEDQQEDIVQVKGIPVALSLKQLKVSDTTCNQQNCLL